MSGNVHLSPEGSLEKAILEATLALLERDGEPKLRMRDVATAVGCSVGLLYHHYGDREGLIEAVRLEQFKSYWSRDIQAFDDAVESSRDLAEFRQKLRVLARIGAGPERVVARRNRAIVLGAALQRPRLLEAVGRLQADFMEKSTSVLAKGQARGFFDPRVDPRAFATLIQAYYSGRIFSDIDGRGPISDEVWGALSERVLLSFT